MLQLINYIEILIPFTARYNYVIRNRMYDYLYWGESFTLKRYMEVPFRGFLPPSESVCDCSKKSTTSTTIHVVTHTYKRVTQKVDLTILCQSLALVDNVVWIVVEDSDSRTELVSRLLSRCPVKSVHLFAECVHAWWSISWLGSHRRGVTQWNTGNTHTHTHTHTHTQHQAKIKLLSI